MVNSLNPSNNIGNANTANNRSATEFSTSKTTTPAPPTRYESLHQLQNVRYLNGPRQAKARRKRKAGYNTGFGMGFGGDESSDGSSGSDDSEDEPASTPHGGNQGVATRSRKKDGNGGGEEGDVGEGGPDLPDEGEGMGDVNEGGDEDGVERKTPVTPTSQVEEVEGGKIEPVQGASGATLFIDEEKEADVAPHEHFTHEEFGKHPADLRLYDEIHHVHPAHHPYLNFLDKHLKPSPARQFFIGDTFYRERKARKVAWEELFSDLVYVGVIQQVSHTIKEASVIDAAELNHVILIFAPIWLTWISNQNYSNTFGTTSSFWHRLHAWLQMLLVSGLGITCSHAFDPDPHHNTARPFAMIYLLSRLLYILSYSKVFISMPAFSAYAAVRMGGVVLASVPWVVVCFLGGGEGREWIWWVGLVMDLVGWGVPLAMNIEHCWERFGLLTMIVLGELVVSILWTSKDDQFEATYAATILGLTITICVQWIYYAIDGGKQFKHALRRNPLTAFLFQLLHLPLHTTLVLSGGSLSILILRIGHIDYVHPQIDASSPVEPWLRYFFIGGFGAVLWWLSFISWCHGSADSTGERVGRRWRTGVRCACGAGLMVYGGVSGGVDPAGERGTAKAMGMIGAVAGVYVFVVLFEQFGRMKRTKVEDVEAAPVEADTNKRSHGKQGRKGGGESFA
ncbi:hypothetical protein HDV00_012170 [Rhizophlyctis rosea]|nr:hypothetical protein HDV00_012170 [Rhizophlyctis rosea]